MFPMSVFMVFYSRMISQLSTKKKFFQHMLQQRNPTISEIWMLGNWLKKYNEENNVDLDIYFRHGRHEQRNRIYNLMKQLIQVDIPMRFFIQIKTHAGISKPIYNQSKRTHIQCT